MGKGMPIGSGMTALFATTAVLYALDGDGNLQQYQFEPDRWTRVSGPMRQFAAGGVTMFALDSVGNVWQFSGVPNQWSQIGAGMNKIVARGSVLLGVASSSGVLWQYENASGGWTEIGGPFKQVATNGSRGFAINNGQVLLYSDRREWAPSARWQCIGGSNPDSLYVAPNALYMVDASGNVYRWQGTPDEWVRISHGYRQFASLGTSLYAIGSDGYT